MRLHSNQSGEFFATAKAHKLEYIEDISLNSLKLHPIIDQTGAYSVLARIFYLRSG